MNPEWRVEDLNDGRITLWIGNQPINFRPKEKWKIEMIRDKHYKALNSVMNLTSN